MRIVCAALLAAFGVAIVVPSQASACSIRGSWCGYPLWAANAFEDPWGRVNERTGPNVPGVRYDHDRVHRPATKRHYHHGRRQKR